MKPRLVCRCLHCDELHEFTVPMTAEEFHRTALPWIFSLIDPPAVGSPRQALVCPACAKKVYGEEFYEEAVAIIRAGAPN